MIWRRRWLPRFHSCEDSMGSSQEQGRAETVTKLGICLHLKLHLSG